MRDLPAKLSDCKILVVGDVIYDLYFGGEVKRLSPEAPVPIVRITKKTSTLGGAGNVALNLTNLGCQVSLFAVRGEDDHGTRISQTLKENGIGDFVQIHPQHITTSKTRIIGQGQQLLRMDEEEIWNGSDVDKTALLNSFQKELKTAHAIILSDYSKGVLTDDIVKSIITLCKDQKVSIFVDPKRRNWQAYRGATCLTPNTSEVEQIVGFSLQDDKGKIIEVAQHLRQEYALDWFVITRGADGICVAGKDHTHFIKATAREVFDVSGAGDTVIAVLTACFVSGLPFIEAAEIANVAAGIVVGKLGAQPVPLNELQSALKA